MNLRDELAELRKEIEEMDGIEARIAAIEAENKELRGKLAAIEARQAHNTAGPAAVDKRAAPASLAFEPGTRVITAAPFSSVPLPSPEEFVALAAIVWSFHPELADCSNMGIHRATPEANRAEWRKQFAAAFLALGSMRRLEAPDRKHYWHHHKDVAEGILRAIGKPETIYYNAFIAACLAWGDIPHSGVGASFQHSGIVPELGLAEHVGRVATDASWRRVLESSKILTPSPPVVRQAPRSPS